jgi:hypothetical protein
MPLSLRVKAPIGRARQKLARPPIQITAGKESALPSTADAYMPTPKKAAGANEMYPVGPENIAQLKVITMYMKMLVSRMTVYAGA